MFSTPVSDSVSGSGPAPSPSMLQHRESSAVLKDDDDIDEEDRNPRIQIDVDGADELEDGTQLSQDISMGEPQTQQPVRTFLFVDIRC
jgi:hypothetical protein